MVFCKIHIHNIWIVKIKNKEGIYYEEKNISINSCCVINSRDTAEITPETVKPVQYTDETAMPADTFYIVHKTKKSGNIYYPLLKANASFTEARTDIAGADPSRIEWVNYNGDEGQIPTMRKGDSIIYKSSTSVPLE